MPRFQRAKGDRDRQYVLGIRHHDQVELVDAFVGGRGRGGKRGRGANNKRPVLVAVEHSANDRADFIAMQAVAQVDSKTVSHFRARLGDELLLRTDSWSAYGILALEHGLQVDSRSPPPEQVDKWLPIVYMAIANLKRFLLGTFHGVSSRKLQKCLDEFVYRYNRRFWESQLP